MSTKNVVELLGLFDLCSTFLQAMRDKLRKKVLEGVTGWNTSHKEYMWDELKKQVDRGPEQVVDIAIYAMFVWFYQQKEKNIEQK